MECLIFVTNQQTEWRKAFDELSDAEHYDLVSPASRMHLLRILLKEFLTTTDARNHIKLGVTTKDDDNDQDEENKEKKTAAKPKGKGGRPKKKKPEVIEAEAAAAAETEGGEAEGVQESMDVVKPDEQEGENAPSGHAGTSEEAGKGKGTKAKMNQTGAKRGAKPGASWSRKAITYNNEADNDDHEEEEDDN